MSGCNHAQWQPPHDYRPLERSSERKTWAVVMLTGLTMLVEIATGYWFNSMALLADGWHMASHMVAIGLAALAYLLARRYAADQRFAFGTWKIEVLAGFTSALLLVVVALFMIGESLSRLWSPVVIGFDAALMVAVIGLLVNLLSAWLLRDQHDHGHGEHAHDHSHEHDLASGGKDLNRHAAFIHVLTDALTSVLAIAALLAGRYLGWRWMDPAVGLLGAVVIARWAWGLMKDTAAILLDTAEPALMARVRTLVEAEGATICDLHVWRIGPHAHASIISLAPGADVARVRARVKSLPRMEHVTVEG